MDRRSLDDLLVLATVDAIRDHRYHLYFFNCQLLAQRMLRLPHVSSSRKGPATVAEPA
jgi:hypothetical protein